MRRELAALGVGLVCLATLVVVTGGTAAPTGPGAVEVPDDVRDVVTAPTGGSGGSTGADGGAAGTESFFAALAASGPVESPLVWGPVVVFGLWLVGAARTMNAAAGLATVLAGAVVGALFLVTTRGSVSGGGSTAVATGDLTVVDLLLLAVFAVFFFAFHLALFAPADGRAYTAGWRPLARLRRVLRETLSAVAALGSDGPDRAALENEVYDAWRAFLDRIDADEGTAPGEAARRARAAGHPPEAVETLRTTFEAVRYGEATATPERVEGVREALAAIPEPEDESDGAAPDEAGGDGLGSADSRTRTGGEPG
jgi:hypothetical protein